MVTKAQKTKTVDDLKASLLNAKLTVVSDYQGTTVSELTQLRREIQQAGGEFTVAKNTLVKRALEGHASSSALDAYLKGPTAVIFTEGDPVPVAKAVTEYIKKVKKTQIKGGVLEGKKITNEDLKSISSLPSKEVLIAKMLGSMNAPAQNVVYALSGVSRNLVYALEAIRKQKEAQG
ncbi:MAG: 50S ribosomal protein L10 [Candidatus Sericytochromatia bacterium]